MIPGHSVVSGIISHINTSIGDLENRIDRKKSEKSTLQNSLSSTKNQLEQIINKKTETQSSIARIKHEKTRKDLSITNLGKKITSFQIMKEDVLKISHKYEFLGVKCNQLGKIILINKPKIENKQLEAILEESGQIKSKIYLIQE